MSMDYAYPYLKNNGSFIIRNITSDRQKTVKIFNFSLLFNRTYDLLQIPGVTEADIRDSLLKGQLQYKIRAKDIIVEFSDIDLLQFNINNKQFLQNSGIINGLTTNSDMSVSRQNVLLSGLVDGVNTIFTVPYSDKFINGNFFGSRFKIQVIHNNTLLTEGQDFIISESGGVGSGYDTIIIISFVPMPGTFLYANYMVSA